MNFVISPKLSQNKISSKLMCVYVNSMQASYLRLSYDLNLIEYDINNTFLLYSCVKTQYVAYDSVSSENLIFNDTQSSMSSSTQL